MVIYLYELEVLCLSNEFINVTFERSKELIYIFDEAIKFKNIALNYCCKIYSVYVSKLNLHLFMIWRELISSNSAVIKYMIKYFMINLLESSLELNVHYVSSAC